MQPTPSASYSLTLRIKLSSRAGSLGDLTTAIGRAGGDIGAIDIVTVGNNYIIRDLTVASASSTHGEQIVQAVKDIDGVELIQVSDPTFLMHLGGKIEVVSKTPLKTRADLSMAYTPGVARICDAIAKDPYKHRRLRPERRDLPRPQRKHELAQGLVRAKHQPNRRRGTVHDVIKGADVFLGLSVPGVINEQDVQNMAEKPIVFAMANPTPEIMPEDAAPYVAVMATGRSDYPNQINNVLCFPGIFRGALACRAARINEEMKLAAANAIAGIITDAELHPEYIVPSVFDKRVAEAVANEVEAAAYRTGVARRASGVTETM